MGNAQRITARDVNAVHELFGECLELWADPVGWRQHWYAGMCRLVGAVQAMGGESVGFFNDPEQRLPIFVYHNLDDEARRLHSEYFQRNGQRTFDAPLAALRDNQKLITRSHEQLVARPRWRKSELFNDYFRPIGIDDRLISVSRRNTDQDGKAVYEGFGLFRELGDRAFSSRERDLVALVHQQLAPNVGSRLATSLERSVYGLSPRLREVLDCILDGDSEKRIALRLDLDRSTVNQYAGRLYRHFGVRSRSELMAYFVRRRPSGSPHPRTTRASRHITRQSSRKPDLS